MTSRWKKIGIGLVGAGRIGRLHARNVCNRIPDAELRFVVDLSERAAAALAEELGVPGRTFDYRRMLDEQSIDAVLVCTATATHHTIVCEAAAAGKHVFCEKPLALTIEGCDDAISAARKYDILLQVGFMRRFDPSYQEAAEWIQSGRIGQPVMIKAVGRDRERTDLQFARRENSGGLIMDMAVHDFDLARWLFASEITGVSTEGTRLVFPELEEAGDIDNAVINFRMENGAIGNIDISRNARYGYDVRTEVLGSEGAVQIGNPYGRPLDLITTNSGSAPMDFAERFEEAFIREMSDFVESIRKMRTPAVSGTEARAATIAAIAATRALDEGRTVTIDEIERSAFIRTADGRSPRA